MINAIDTAAFQRIACRLALLSPSWHILWMADGPLVPSTGVWTGQILWGLLQLNTSFEVFPSRGFWQILLDKPLLK
jgi:hypothetical protein